MILLHPIQAAIGPMFATWRALFLREAVGRLFSGRFAWAWILLEPLAHIAFLVWVFTVVRVRTVGGIESEMWIMVGLLAFFMFKRPFNQSLRAIGANKSLFAYRQVKPVDTVIVRAGLEAFLMVGVMGALFVGAALVGLSVQPAHPLLLLTAMGGMWLVGLGGGLVASSTVVLVPELDNILGVAMMPLYLVSGVMFPIASVPEPYRSYLLWNPLAHGVEAARAGLSAEYSFLPELSVFYLYTFALTLVLFGLALHRRFAQRLVAQ